MFQKSRKASIEPEAEGSSDASNRRDAAPATTGVINPFTSSARNNPGRSLNLIPLPSIFTYGNDTFWYPPDPLTRFCDDDDAQETPKHVPICNNPAPVAMSVPKIQPQNTRNAPNRIK